jgi:hypothetical protein
MERTMIARSLPLILILAPAGSAMAQRLPSPLNEGVVISCPPDALQRLPVSDDGVLPLKEGLPAITIASHRSREEGTVVIEVCSGADGRAAKITLKLAAIKERLNGSSIKWACRTPGLAEANSCRTIEHVYRTSDYPEPECYTSHFDKCEFLPGDDTRILRPIDDVVPTKPPAN